MKTSTTASLALHIIAAAVLASPAFAGPDPQSHTAPRPAGTAATIGAIITPCRTSSPLRASTRRADSTAAQPDTRPQQINAGQGTVTLWK